MDKLSFSLPLGGNPIYQVDDGYLHWMLNNFPESSELKKASIARGKMKVTYNVDVYNLLTDLKSCSMRKDVDWGRRIHAKAVGIRQASNIYVGTALIKMYAKCGLMGEARSMFDDIQKPDVVCWTVLVMGYAENGEGQEALKIFSRMEGYGCKPDSVTYVAAIKACTSLAGKHDTEDGVCLDRGRKIHSEIGRYMDHYVQSALIDMYVKFSCVAEARGVFDSIQKPDVVCWTALLLGYVGNGDGLATLDLFSRMKACGCAPDSRAYVAALKACTSLASKRDGSAQMGFLNLGREIHSEISWRLDLFIQNTLIDMYANCGSMGEARQVFDSIRNPDIVSWNVLILGYAENGEGVTALDLFSKLKAVLSCTPNSFTFVAALKACTFLRGGLGQGECLQRGSEIHSEIRCELDIFVQNTLIDMYASCGSMVDARHVFDDIQNPDVVSWNVLLLGYAENGEGFTTLELFTRMKAQCTPTAYTYVAALKACGVIGALPLGRKLHTNILEFDTHVVTCLVDFYAKCGSMVEAYEVFLLHSTARVVPMWNALLAGYASFGDIDSVVCLFRAMQDEGFQPDAVTFVCILSCCSRAGLVEKAREYFEAMPVQYGIIPSVMHYNCMVDIMGRANQLNGAIRLLRVMPCKADAVTWITLLGACRKWKNVEIGRFAFDHLVDMEKRNESAYVLMAHIYARWGMKEEQEMILEMGMKFGLPRQT